MPDQREQDNEGQPGWLEHRVAEGQKGIDGGERYAGGEN